jgi:hypothetical protein
MHCIKNARAVVEILMVMRSCYVSMWTSLQKVLQENPGMELGMPNHAN